LNLIVPEVESGLDLELLAVAVLAVAVLAVGAGVAVPVGAAAADTVAPSRFGFGAAFARVFGGSATVFAVVCFLLAGAPAPDAVAVFGAGTTTTAVAG